MRVRPGPPTCDLARDGDQLEQLLINLVNNAVEAAAETGGEVEITLVEHGPARSSCAWSTTGRASAETANLFVPFFTTKPNGTGIGLVLSRQIAEAHGGTLTLENRRDARGLRGAAAAATGGAAATRVFDSGTRIPESNSRTRDTSTGFSTTCWRAATWRR